ncbi:MAG: secondary thiamine-phosphate synthase enzyme [Enterovirga sp.]|jgi:secondary thiamine-phosphate synthase enzyme|nr:secondary thiamine-phosphate synthase enzyme [Enterovirga sp.]
MRVETLSCGPVTRQATGQLVVSTRGPGFTAITGPVQRFVAESGIASGVATLLCRHTSASLTVQENADPDVRTDLAAALDRLAPRNGRYLHDSEGPDDMPAHIRTMLTGVTLSLPVVGGRLALGTWQDLYLVEHRDRPHRREIVVNLVGE